MNTRVAITLSALTVLAAASQAQNFASFLDSGVLFTRTATSISGSGNVALFELNNVPYNNVSFEFTATPLDNGGTGSLEDNAILSAGSFRIFDGSTDLLTVDFKTAELSMSPGTGGTLLAADNDTDPLTSLPLVDNVTFGGLVSSTNANDDSFGFSFTLVQPPVDGQRTAAFTASGTVQAVPEPASLAALGLGVAALVRRRRR